MRATQILGNERRRERERQERKVDEARILEECKRKLEEEKERQVGMFSVLGGRHMQDRKKGSGRIYGCR